MKNNIIFFDLESSGLPLTPRFGKFYDYKDTAKYDPSRIVSYAFFLSPGDRENIMAECCNIAFPDNFKIGNSDFHGITQEMAVTTGVKWQDVTGVLENMANESETVAGHNIEFDVYVLCSELYRRGYKDLALKFFNKKRICTMKIGTPVTCLPGRFGDYKYPKLSELYRHLFKEEMKGAHNAIDDIRNTMKCFYILKLKNLI